RGVGGRGVPDARGAAWTQVRSGRRSGGERGPQSGGPLPDGEGAAARWTLRRVLLLRRHGRVDLYDEAVAPGGLQDPRTLHRAVLAGHPAAARRQGAVRRPAV